MRDKRYNYYRTRVDEIKEQYPDAWISVKEKYGRFDILYHSVPPSIIEELDNMEEESMSRCQDCAKLRKQIWFEQGGWLQHTCFRCYLLHLPKIIWIWIRRQRYKLLKKRHE